MQIKFAHPIESRGVVRWQPGQLLTVRIVTADDDGSYMAETMETVPADIRERHAAEIDRLHAFYAQRIAANLNDH